MNDFEEIKSTVKDKWLDYYESNQSWLALLLEKSEERNSNSRSFIILTVLTVWSQD